MEIISFTSLFLGLITGPHTVEVAVTKPVAAVELRLDGRTIGLLRQPPWALPCDFGTALRPHRITALALDDGGNALASTDQWINMFHRDAEAEIVLRRDGSGVPVEAVVAWDSLEFNEPRGIGAALDGAPLKATAPGHFTLPPLAKGRLHLLAARVEFPRGIVATAEVAVGDVDQEAVANLTAVPVVLEEGARLAEAASLQGSFLAKGAPQRVVAVEEGPAEVVIVCDADAGRRLRRLGGKWTYQRPPRGPGSLGEEDGVRLMLTTPHTQKNRGRVAELFDVSQRLTQADGGIPWLLMTRVPRMVERGRQSIADAVAVAGVEATRDNRRRAVVLVLGTGADEQSNYSIAAVRDFLEGLHVPLLVWSLLPQDSKKRVTGWGATDDASSAAAMDGAVGRLRALLAAQRIVWIEGKHLPCDLALAPTQTSLRLAGGTK